MRSKVLNENGERTFAVIFETGDEVLSGLKLGLFDNFRSMKINC